eukprot:TRINITY_DN14505_c0_g1_i1.p1 TRINITY_DN14505_c0_g1~~TRINITY_DN14505_c0_g1_i1.p1  ORF type:complete len:272 (+),score=32.05 TRINITY_DN14505_c0_g1_i1:253-1068(+)
MSESIYRDVQEEITRKFTSPLRSFRRSRIWRATLGLCWFLLHLMVSIVLIVLQIDRMLQSYLISTGLLEKYKCLDIEKLRYLALVVDSDEARHSCTTKIVELLRWLSSIGVKHVCLYDMEGVLKESADSILRKMQNTSIIAWKEADEKAVLLDRGNMTLEFLSFSDGKEGAAKAAQFLCSEYFKGPSLDVVREEPNFTELDMDRALRSVGCGGPEPDLLLIYGPTRCHLGFPAWRLRYTEIVHLGKLRSMKYGALRKAIYEFTKKHQNYGS